MTFLEDRDLSEVPLIPEYFNNKTIFITGGTGFIGKILLEKLLYSCSTLNKIFILMRDKKGVNPEERLTALYNIPCFDRLRKERPGLFESKVQFIAGDMNEDFLGISEDDRILIVNSTNIIFHVAASVRFDDTLETATKLNLLGTKEIIELAKDMRHLESFVHVSTAFSNTLSCCVEEQIYTPVADWRETIEICKNMDSSTLRAMTPKYIEGSPNTYVFTKQLSEHMLCEERGKLPIVICRPSIVTSTLVEPFPGWIDNFNGPVGILVAAGKGVLQSFYNVPDINIDVIPVDFVVKGIIAAAWSRGTKSLESTDDVPVYNNCDGDYNCFNYDDLVTMGLKILQKTPLDNVVWPSNNPITSNIVLHFSTVLLKQIIPALFIDIILRISGKKPILIKLQRRLFMVHIALDRYLTKYWYFSVKNLQDLRSAIKEKDQDEFNYVDHYDRLEYYTQSFLGAKKYLLKEKDEDIPKAKAHIKRLIFFMNAIKILFFSFVFWWIYKKYGQCLANYL